MLLIKCLLHIIMFSQTKYLILKYSNILLRHHIIVSKIFWCFKRKKRKPKYMIKSLKMQIRPFWATVSDDGWPAVTVVTPSVSTAHLRTLLTDVNIIQSPLVLLLIVILDPSEACRTRPTDRKQNETREHCKCIAVYEDAWTLVEILP